MRMGKCFCQIAKNLFRAPLDFPPRARQMQAKRHQQMARDGKHSKEPLPQAFAFARTLPFMQCSGPQRLQPLLASNKSPRC